MPTIKNIHLEDIELEHVTYRLSNNAELAYIQFLASPWNDVFSVLSIQSETNNGHDNAVTALTNSDVRRTLVGNFAILHGNQIVSDNIQFVSTDIENIGIKVFDFRSLARVQNVLQHKRVQLENLAHLLDLLDVMQSVNIEPGHGVCLSEMRPVFNIR